MVSETDALIQAEQLHEIARLLWCKAERMGDTQDMRTLRRAGDEVYGVVERLASAGEAYTAGLVKARRRETTGYWSSRGQRHR